MSKWTGLRRLSYNSRGRVGGAGGGATPAHQQLLDRATAGGWSVLYDPTDPDRTLRNDGSDDYISAIPDPLGNAGDKVQGTAADQAQLFRGRFGDLDGGLNAATTGGYDTDTSFPTISQPFYYVTVVRSTDLSFDRLFEDNTSGNLAGSLGDGSFRFTFGANLDSPSDTLLVDTDYIISILANGVSSEMFVNSASVVSGDAGTNDFAQGLPKWWNRDDEDRPWKGYFGPTVIGNVSAAEHTAMLDLLHDLTGIAKA